MFGCDVWLKKDEVRVVITERLKRSQAAVYLRAKKLGVTLKRTRAGLKGKGK
jgi:hypothetical protein